MIKLSKKIILTLFLLTISIAIGFVIRAFQEINSPVVFRHLSKVFLAMLIGGVFQNLFIQNNFSRLQILDRVITSLVLTKLILIISSIVFGLVIIQLIDYGFGTKALLYWQISTFILALFTFVIYIKNHMVLLKKP